MLGRESAQIGIETGYTENPVPFFFLSLSSAASKCKSGKEIREKKLVSKTSLVVPKSFLAIFKERYRNELHGLKNCLLGLGGTL